MLLWKSAHFFILRGVGRERIIEYTLKFNNPAIIILSFFLIM